MEWERFKVQKHPDVLGFNATHCAPHKSNETLTVHTRILPAVLPFVEKVGHEREKLYREERQKLFNENIVIESRRQQLSGMRHILPFDLIVTGTGNRSTFCRGVHLPDQLNDYIQSIVVPDREKEPSTLYD